MRIAHTSTTQVNWHLPRTKNEQENSICPILMMYDRLALLLYPEKYSMVSVVRKFFQRWLMQKI